MRPVSVLNTSYALRITVSVQPGRSLLQIGSSRFSSTHPPIRHDLNAIRYSTGTHTDEVLRRYACKSSSLPCMPCCSPDTASSSRMLGIGRGCISCSLTPTPNLYQSTAIRNTYSSCPIYGRPHRILYRQSIRPLPVSDV